MIKKITLLVIVALFRLILFSQIPIPWDYKGGNNVSLPASIKASDVLSLSVKNIKDTNDFDKFVQRSSIKKKDEIIVFEKFFKTKSDYKDFRAAHVINNVDIGKAFLSIIKDGDSIAISLLDQAGTSTTLSTKVLNSGNAGGGGTVANGGSGTQSNVEENPDVISAGMPDLPSFLAKKEIKFDKSTTTYLSDIYDNEDRYDKENNRAFLIVDENGNLLGSNPVNIDQDDRIYLIVIGKKNKLVNMHADFIGSYAPSDLQMRSFAAIDGGFSGNGLNEAEDTIIVFSRGPFTDASVNIKLKAGNNSAIAAYSLRVNTLFHLGFGVSINRTALQNPDYKVTPLSSSTNTISKVDGGHRNMVSFNVIWYWSSTFRYLIRGSNITRGRDVLKEPSFFERINPTFGVSFANNITDNLFAGLTFEFARGGSLVGGYHFGKVKKLAIPNFTIGETVFTGTDADIKTSMESENALFFGLIIDTRIFNALFKKQ